MNEQAIVVTDTVIVEDQTGFSFTQLCQVCSADPAQIQMLVEEGILTPAGETPPPTASDWWFEPASLKTTRVALRLARDLDLSMAGVALVMSLRSEIERLQARLQRAGLSDKET